MQVKGFLLATILGCLGFSPLAVGQDSELRSAREWIVDQPQDFSNEVLFERQGQMIVRSSRFTQGSEIFGDFDGDGDVDQHDYYAMQICLSFFGPGLPTPPACFVFDSDGDGHVDLVDTAAFQNAYTGTVSRVLVEAGELLPASPSPYGYYSGPPGAWGNNALNGIARQAGYSQDDLWYQWTLISKPIDSGNVLITNSALPASAYSILPPSVIGEYMFQLRVTNLITLEFGLDPVTLFVTECLSALDCNDDNPCTADSCNGFVCEQFAVAGCCIYDGDCDDALTCTSDYCVDNQCYYQDECNGEFAVFVDPSSGHLTSDVYDIDLEVVRFRISNQSIVYQDGTEYQAGYWPVFGNFLGDGQSFRVRFGQGGGLCRAYFTETGPGTICDFAISNGSFQIFPTIEAPQPCDVCGNCDPVCGNGGIEAGEQCDDGNTTSGDGCSSTCQREATGIANDNCANPVAIGEGTQVYSNVGATTDGPLELEKCTFFGRSDIRSDLWYCYTPTCTGQAAISLCGSGYDTKMAVYSGCTCPTEGSSARVLACSDDDCGTGTDNTQSRITLSVTSGQSYLVRVGGFFGNRVEGEGRLTIRCGQDTCVNGTGSCTTAHADGEPGCETASCCSRVCDVDTFCCDVTWDAFCASQASGFCSTTGFPSCSAESGACNAAQTTPGCNNPECCNAVCETDPFCCISTWDENCVSQSNLICATCGRGRGECDVAHTTPGCNDVSCCAKVCAADEFCCNSEWDATCAQQAQDLCGH